MEKSQRTVIPLPGLDFRVFFEALPDPCVVLDLDYKILWGNEAFFQTTLTIPEEILGRDICDVFPDNPYDPNATGVRRLKESLSRVMVERARDAMGLVKYDIPVSREKNAFEVRYWNSTNVPVFGPDNQITHIIHHTKDVTQFIRKDRDVQADLKRILDGIPDIAWLKDAEGKFIWVNQPFADACGVGVEELVGKNDMDIWPPELAARYMADDADVIEKKRRKSVEEPLVNVNGEKTWIETIKTPAYDNAGELIGTIGIARDITERKRTEAALQALNEDFTTLLDNTTDFIYLKDENSRFRFCSQSLARLTGHPDWHAMIGKHDRDVFPAEMAKIYTEEELPIFEQGKALLDKTDPFIDEHGKRGWVNTNKWPIFNCDKSQVVGIFGISRDITERMQTELANRELEAFNYTVAHDLRKPLTVINGYCQAMKVLCGDALTEQCAGYLQKVYESTLRMNRLIEALLNFSSVAPPLELHRKTVDLSVSAKEVVAELASAEPDRQVMVTIQSGMKAETDPDLLRVVLSNLIGNAWKYTSNRAEAIIEFGATVINDEKAYFVRDNGVGFDPAEADKLFAPFHRLEGEKEIGGLGIGLATVERIIKRHGGNVWAQGAPGNGATFYFTLGE